MTEKQCFKCDGCRELVTDKYAVRRIKLKKKSENKWRKPETVLLHGCGDCAGINIDDVMKTFDCFLVEDEEVVGVQASYYEEDDRLKEDLITEEVLLEDLGGGEYGNEAIIEAACNEVEDFLEQVTGKVL